jgi:hypothetical protein
LPEAGDEFPAGTSAEVSGWGVTDAGGASDVLMAVTVKIDSDAGKTTDAKIDANILFWHFYGEKGCLFLQTGLKQLT